MITKKKCNQCKKIKPIDEFYKRNDRLNGYHQQCKKCIADKRKVIVDGKIKFPTWVCPKCYEKVELDFLPTTNLKLWKKFVCPSKKCKFSPSYGKQ